MPCGILIIVAVGTLCADCSPSPVTGYISVYDVFSSFSYQRFSYFPLINLQSFCFCIEMGSGGLNGELRNQSDQVDAILRYHFAVPHDSRSTPQHQRTTTANFPSTNPHNSTTNPTPEFTEMVCYLCSVNFTLFKRKSTCRGCKKTLCSNCFTQGLNARDQSPRCITCRALAAPSTHKDFLQYLKIKDLQDFLRLKNIPMSQCKEKRDLIELILQYSQPRRYPDFPRGTPHPPPPVTHDQRQGGTHPNSNSGQTANRVNRAGENNACETKEATRRTIDDITDIEQVDNLSVKELKHILTANFVDFKGCVEKEELLSKVRLLWKSRNCEKQKVENVSESLDESCKVCMDNLIDCVLLECGHMVACINCSKQLAECPICRQNISRIVRVFKA
ncbi:E3 ubiquitin-protein ligase RNF34 [Nematostella vectensis]|uniref:E3 ubiquitin-protein ligase RNF34 n=1 Tax=Nematostella vectensis TaxID=45351 RepID=UPI0020776228|nr:E3 ubiquitin-protein ligase RNF34 [Nematostella vectensis]